MDKEPPEQPEAEGANEDVRARVQALLADTVKRAFSAGLGSVFGTEESIRRVVGEFSLPKDVAGFLATQAQGTRDEVFRVLANEFRKWLDRLDLEKELVHLLGSLSVEIKTEVRFKSHPTTVLEPEVKQKVQVRRESSRDRGDGGNKSR